MIASPCLISLVPWPHPAYYYFQLVLKVMEALFVCCVVVVPLFVVEVLSLQDTEQESWLSCLQPLYDVKALSSEDPANLAKSVGLKE